MASTSDRRSASSGPSKRRKRIVIGPGDRTRDRYASLEVEVSDTGRRSSAAQRRKPVHGDLSSAGRHVAGGKAEQRELRLKAHRRVLRLRLLGLLVVVVAAVMAGVWLYRSPIFTIRNIDVIGTTRLDSQAVRDLADVGQGATLLRLSTRRLEARLERNAWIASAEVSRDFPDTVRIRVRERVAEALVDLGGKDMWLVDASGVWLEKSSAEATTVPVTIRDVAGLDPVPGRRTRSEALINALEIVRALTASLAPLVRTVSAPAIDKTTLITSSDVEILIGASDDIARKQQVAEEILTAQKGKVVYINVRIVDRPTWRGLDSDR